MTAKSLLLIGAAMAAAILLSFVATPFFMRLAKKTGWIDIPADGRRMHTHPVPLLGGLSIILAFYAVSLACALFLNGRGEPLMLHMFGQLLPGSLIIAAMAFLDDKYNLPPLPRLGIQCVAAGITVALGVRITFISGSVRILGQQIIDLHDWSVPITILWIVGVTNALNWIDGLDGLAAGISSISSISILAISILQIQPQVAVAVLTAALAGGCLGLLPFNRYPAKIFMGDTGAMFLGFTLSVISIQGLFKFYAAISFAVPLLVLGLPLFDTVSAIVRRIAEGKSPFSADRNHIHHKLIDLGLSQRQAVLLLHIISIVLGILAVLFTLFNTIIGWRFSIAGLVIVVLIFWGLLALFRRYNAAAAVRTAAGTEPDCRPDIPCEKSDAGADASARPDPNSPPDIPGRDTRPERKRSRP